MKFGFALRSRYTVFSLWTGAREFAPEREIRGLIVFYPKLKSHKGHENKSFFLNEPIYLAVELQHSCIVTPGAQGEMAGLREDVRSLPGPNLQGFPSVNFLRYFFN